MSQMVVPFRQFVLKVHSRCDLACDHCYIYHGADQDWRRRPTVMSAGTAAHVARRIAEHAAAHQLARVHVVLHGGEPLLAGRTRMREIAAALRAAVDGVCDLDLRIHTNGVLLDEAFCELFSEFDVKVGVSLDGDRAANDRHRRYADGRSSYDKVIRAVNLLRAGPRRRLYAGLLCTIDLANDPVAVYRSLLALEPPRVDFLLPHATWDAPPFRPAGELAPYADWLIGIYDQWRRDGRPIGVRMFDSIRETAAGRASLTESLGLGPSDLAVIETDGSYEQADSLKIAFEGAAATGLNVAEHDLDQLGRHPGIRARQRDLAGLCPRCQACPVVVSCGGGLFAHRHRSGSGFSNPSVYCPDLLKLITHVRERETPLMAGACAPATPAHGLTAAELDALAAGHDDGAAVASLREAQRSVGRALVAAAWQGAAAGGEAAAAALRPAWDVLTRIDRSHPQALGEVLSHPYLRVWAVRCVRLLRSAGDPPAAPVAEAGHLASVAIAAAIRAGVPARLSVPVRGGAVHLPTLGRLAVGDADIRAADVESADGIVTVRAGEARWRAQAHPGAASVRLIFGRAGANDWSPVRHLSADGLTVALEDTDPFRDCHQWPAAPRQAPAQFAQWQDRFQRAWELIRAEHAEYAPGLAAGLTALMPLSKPQPGREVSATARDAFGVVAAALPADATTLALLLIHEFQHVKLGAVLDLYELFDASDRRVFHAPWREDPRPLEGLLQGAYAHVAVTGYWRARRRTGGPDGARAAGHFAHWRGCTAGALDTLADSGSLTPLGARFLDGMRATLSPWLAEPAAATEGVPARGATS